MTPNEKAKELYNTFYSTNSHGNSVNVRSDLAKNFAMKCVDEIYSALYSYLKDTDELQNADREFAYWEQVKQEIKKL